MCTAPKITSRGRGTMKNDVDCALHVGFGVTDVTPPEGLPMAGSLDPRPNRGTTDPLLAKKLYARGGGGEVGLHGPDASGPAAAGPSRGGPATAPFS